MHHQQLSRRPTYRRPSLPSTHLHQGHNSSPFPTLPNYQQHRSSPLSPSIRPQGHLPQRSDPITNGYVHTCIPKKACPSNRVAVAYQAPVMNGTSPVATGVCGAGCNGISKDACPKGRRPVGTTPNGGISCAPKGTCPKNQTPISNGNGTSGSSSGSSSGS
jgi:hypothetical protein